MTIYLTTALKSYVSSYQGLPSLAWQGIIICFIESTLIGICYFLSLYFVNELHIDIAKAGILMSFYGIGTVIGGLIGGKLSDRISPITVSIIGLLIQSFAYLILTQLQSFYLLSLNLLIIGMGSYSFITANYVWVLAYCHRGENERLKALNILGVASNLGLGLSAMIISLFTTHHFTSLFLFSGSVLLLTACYLMVIRKNSINPSKSTLVSQKDQSTSLFPRKKTIAWLALLCLFLMGIIISQTNSNYSLYLQEIFPEMGIKSFSILFTINTLMVVFLQAPVVDLFSTSNKVLMIGIGAFLLGFGMAMLVFSYTFPIAILACVVMTLGEIIFFAYSQLICYEEGDEGKKGHSLGTYRMVYAGSRIAGPLLGGFIYQTLGGNMLWYLCGVFGLICLMGAISLV